MRHVRTVMITALAALAAGAAPALAHTDVGQTSGFLGGLGHPFSGLDHMLAMLAVGIWSALANKGHTGRVWVAPVAFVAAMLVGATAGHLHMPLPVVETGIAVSVILLGLMIVAGVELPLVVGVTLIAVFAIYRGHAHGAEATGDIVSYMAGFSIATATLHVAGIGLGLVLTRVRIAAIAAGTLITVAGACLLAS